MVHPALLNADIVSIISESLDKESLSVLARTARFLQDPALRELWRDIHKLSHLLFPFGSSVKRAQGKHRFCRDPSSTEWERFKFYAPFVRNLSIRYDDAIAPSSLRILSHHQPLLPRLKSLVVWSWPDKEYCFLSMFFVPSIQRFDVFSCEDFLALESLMLKLGATAPALRHLDISGSQLPTGQFATSISVFHKLHSIDIPLTGLHAHSILSHLSTLPSLSNIRLSITGFDGVSGTGSKYPFPAARVLVINCESDDQPTYFLALTWFENLANLAIACENYLIDDGSLCRAVSVSCGQSLNQIEIGDGRKDPKSMKSSILDPLSKFTNLRSFTFSALDTLWPTDEDITDIAKAWPNLEELCVDPCLDEDPIFPLTLTGLLLLIEKCPNLMEIAVPVNAMHLPIANSIRRPGLIINIKSWYSPIDDPKSVADFLNLTLPDAEIVMYEEGVDENYRLWDDALNLREYYIKGWEAREKYVIEESAELHVALDESRRENARLRALQN